jgi:hypothetical protein
MTTEQLINLVAFLQSRYQLRLPDYPFAKDRAAHRHAGTESQ